MKELRSSASQHQNIVQFIGFVAVGNYFYILLPVAEMDLGEFLTATSASVRPRLSIKKLVSEATDVAGALTHLHGGLQTDRCRARVCHRDFKPANILVFPNEGDPIVGRWKITDFGISHLTWGGRETSIYEVVDTITGTVRTPAGRPPGTYSAPEVCDGEDVGRSSDVWAFGCILVRILARGIEGVTALKRLDTARGKTTYGGEDYKNDNFYRAEESCLNPHVDSWVDLLPYYPNCEKKGSPTLPKTSQVYIVDRQGQQARSASGPSQARGDQRFTKGL
jgi:serine/threonine protein kinase